MPHFLLRKSSFKRLFSFSKQDNNIPPFEDNNSKLTVLVTEPTQQKPTWKCFTHEENFEATDGFNSGGYAEVYIGVMEYGKVLAVKRLNRAATDERKEREFLIDIGTIGHVHHPNVSSILGCCIGNGFYFIFEFSLNSSVASVLHDEDSPAMSWKIWFKITVGTAEGLNYLLTGGSKE